MKKIINSGNCDDNDDLSDHDEWIPISLSGLELALLLSCDTTSPSGFCSQALRDKVPLGLRRAFRCIAAGLYDDRSELLIGAGVYMPPLSSAPSPEYVHQHKTIQKTVWLTKEDLHTCGLVTRLVHEALAADEREWRNCCEAEPYLLAWFQLTPTDLLDLSLKLATATAPPQQPRGAYVPWRWPPPESVCFLVTGAELELLVSSLLAQQTAALLAHFLLGEHLADLRSARLFEAPTARRAAFRSKLFLMREQLHVCIASLERCHAELCDEWRTYHRRDPLELHQAEPDAHALLHLADKLSWFLNDEGAGLAASSCASFTAARNVALDGAALALLVAATFLLRHWRFERASAREMLPAPDDHAVEAVAEHLSRAARAAFAPGDALLSEQRGTPAFIARRAATQNEIPFTPLQLRLSVLALEVCHAEFHAKWAEFCNASPGALHWYAVTPESLLQLATTLRGLLLRTCA